MSRYSDLYPYKGQHRGTAEVRAWLASVKRDSPAHMPAQLRGNQTRSYRAAVQTVTAADTATTLQGVAVPFGQWTQITTDMFERFMPGAFDALEAAQTPLPLLVAHDSTRLPVGVSTRWEQTNAGLNGTWKLDTEDPVAKDAARKARSGFVTGLSISFQGSDQDQITTDAQGRIWVTRWNPRLLEVS